METTNDELRCLLKTAVNINDDYLKCLQRKDSVILRQQNTIDTLNDRVAHLEGLLFAEIPEVSQ